MAAKGGTLNLDDRAIEVAAFLTNALIKKVEPELQIIDTNIRKLNDAGVENLKGGRGDEILSALHSAQKQVNLVRTNINKISKFLDTKLGAVMEAIKDRDDIASTAEKMRANAEKARLKKE